jgi:hypothetical protein
MFNNVPEFFQYIQALQNSAAMHIEKTKKNLNYKCEACKTKEIELIYKYENYVTDIFDESGHKMKLNFHCFCNDCYKKIILTNQLPKSNLMEKIDKTLGL